MLVRTLEMDLLHSASKGTMDSVVPLYTRCGEVVLWGTRERLDVEGKLYII